MACRAAASRAAGGRHSLEAAASGAGRGARRSPWAEGGCPWGPQVAAPMERGGLPGPQPRVVAGGDRRTAAVEVPTVGAPALVVLPDMPA